MITSNIYSFSDYRAFLKDRYKQLKDADPLFSFRFFSKQAGFGSPNYLKLVMDGKRNLSFDAIAKFAKGLRLDSHEAEFFRYMVEYNQCDHMPKKRVYEAKLMYLRELFKVKAVIPELYDYYHDWYHAAIREMVKKGKVKNEPTRVGQSLVPAITEEEARSAITLLIQLNFVKTTADGYLEACEETTELSPENAALAEKIHLEQMAELATESLYIQGPETLDFASLTLSLSTEKAAELKKKVAAVLAEFTSQEASKSGEAVYQLNVQLFALTKPMIQGKDDSVVAA